jgi:hypothetical protein
VCLLLILIGAGAKWYSGSYLRARRLKQWRSDEGSGSGSAGSSFGSEGAAASPGVASSNDDDNDGDDDTGAGKASNNAGTKKKGKYTTFKNLTFDDDDVGDDNDIALAGKEEDRKNVKKLLDLAEDANDHLLGADGDETMEVNVVGRGDSNA